MSLKFAPLLEARADDAEVVVGGRGVDHDHHLVLGQAEDDQVVDDPSLFVEEKAVAGAPLRNGGDGEGEDVFETARDDVAPVEELAHVADVEEGGLLPAPAVFGEDPPLVLDRHVPAAEGGQEGLLFPMSANEGCFPEQLHKVTSLGGYRVPQFTRFTPRCKSKPLPSLTNISQHHSITGIGNSRRIVHLMVGFAEKTDGGCHAKESRVYAMCAVLSLVFAGVALADDHAIKLSEKDGVGKFLTDAKGMTLYIFKKDSPGKSACAGPCVEKWPLYFREKVTVPDGVNGRGFRHHHPGGREAADHVQGMAPVLLRRRQDSRGCRGPGDWETSGLWRIRKADAFHHGGISGKPLLARCHEGLSVDQII